MPSWILRDQALHISGLLNIDLGGPSVKPYQPKGIWAEATLERSNTSRIQINTFTVVVCTSSGGELLGRRFFL